MTLKTEVWLSGTIHGRAAFELALAAILTAGGQPGRRATVKVNETRAGTPSGYGWVEWCDSVVAAPGQGLPAWTGADFRQDGSPLHPEDYYEDGRLNSPACTARVWWDTSYGYPGGAGALHAAALRVLAGSLPDGVTLRWKDEFTGRIYDGPGTSSLAVLAAHDRVAR